MKRLRYDQRAISDLDGIYDYIAEHDIAAAARVVARIKALSEQLPERPLLGRKTDMPDIRIRSVVRFPYVIFYTITTDEIAILHVRHTARQVLMPDDIG